GVCLQDLVDLTGGDLLAAPVDQLLDPADQLQVAVGVQAPAVAGAEPAVNEGGGVGLRVALVAVDHVGALDGHLAVLQDPDLDPGAGPYRARLARGGR